jgi:hypothetical protein
VLYAIRCFGLYSDLSALSDETPQSCMDLYGLSREAADKSAVTTISATLPAMCCWNDLGSRRATDECGSVKCRDGRPARKLRKDSIYIYAQPPKEPSIFVRCLNSHRVLKRLSGKALRAKERQGRGCIVRGFREAESRRRTAGPSRRPGSLCRIRIFHRR